MRQGSLSGGRRSGSNPSSDPLGARAGNCWRARRGGDRRRGRLSRPETPRSKIGRRRRKGGTNHAVGRALHLAELETARELGAGAHSGAFRCASQQKSDRRTRIGIEKNARRRHLGVAAGIPPPPSSPTGPADTFSPGHLFLNIAPCARRRFSIVTIALMRDRNDT